MSRFGFIEIGGNLINLDQVFTIFKTGGKCLAFRTIMSGVHEVVSV